MANGVWVTTPSGGESRRRFTASPFTWGGPNDLPPQSGFPQPAPLPRSSLAAALP